MRQGSLSDPAGLSAALEGCDAVAHCAGINREIGAQTYEAIHVRGTANLVRAAELAGVRRLAITSFLRARPNCGSPYHESKWRAEEIVRASQLEWTVLKPGMIFGRGDHMLDHLSHALYTFPVFVGMGHVPVRPLAVQDVVEVVKASLVDGRLAGQTLGLVGPTCIEFDDAARLVANVIGKRRLFVRAPRSFHRSLAIVSERTMVVPLIATAQVRILEEGVAEPILAPDPVPKDLSPTTEFNHDSIRVGLPDSGRFVFRDFRLSMRSPRNSPPGSTLIFDGDCGFCTTVATWAEGRLKGGERVAPWQTMADDELARHHLTRRELSEAAWWVDDPGLRDKGSRAAGRAFRAIGGPWAVLGWLSLYPPTSWIAAGLYRLVSRYRFKLPGGTPACQVSR
jgi:NADH dehydrogenase